MTDAHGEIELMQKRCAEQVQEAMMRNPTDVEVEMLRALGSSVNLGELFQAQIGDLRGQLDQAWHPLSDRFRVGGFARNAYVVMGGQPTYKVMRGGVEVGKVKTIDEALALAVPTHLDSDSTHGESS